MTDQKPPLPAVALAKAGPPPPPPIRKPTVSGTRRQASPGHAAAKPQSPQPASRPPRGRSSGRPSGGRGRGGRGPGRGRGRATGTPFGSTRPLDVPSLKQPPRNPDAMYLIPLGGLEEIGRNAAAVEYKNDIVVVDLGLMFPNENMYGIDYVIPDISPLAGKEKNIKGVIITHAHYDHFGGVP
ncbi:MAG: MBL fold metallo-hydrolase, partial [Patescibacteria group bacterium]